MAVTVADLLMVVGENGWWEVWRFHWLGRGWVFIGEFWMVLLGYVCLPCLSGARVKLRGLVMFL